MKLSFFLGFSLTVGGCLVRADVTLIDQGRSPLRAYLLAKLLWNPETDIRKHTAEFLAPTLAPPPKVARLPIWSVQLETGRLTGKPGESACESIWKSPAAPASPTPAKA